MTQKAATKTDLRQDSIRIYRARDDRRFRLEASQWLPRPPEETFEFFSDAFQLQTLTPPWLHFCVLTPRPIELQEGALIDYQLRVHGFPGRACLLQAPRTHAREANGGTARASARRRSVAEDPTARSCFASAATASPCWIGSRSKPTPSA
jgi:hypothetical protein